MPDGSLDETLSKVSQEAKVEQESQFQEEAAHLRARVRQLETQIRSYQEQRGLAREIGAMVTDAVHAVEPYPRTEYREGSACSSPITAVIDVSDLHIGDQVSAAETEDFGEFNWAIAQSRFFGYIQSVIDWVSLNRNSYKIDVLYVLGKGDYINGNINEQEYRNEFPLPVQTANAGTLLGEGLVRLAPNFQSLVFIGVGADNHGRLRAKPQNKQKAQNNMSFLVHEIAKAYTSRHENIDFRCSVSMKEVVEIANHRLLIEHGDTIRGWAGLPFYGMERTKAREAVKRMGTKKDFHYYSIAHFHTPCIIGGNILVNGSLSGTTEFDHACGRNSPPCQVSYLMHPKHGMFNWTPWQLAKKASA